MRKKNTYIPYLRLLCLSFLLLSLFAGCSKEDEAPQPELVVEFNKGSSVFLWDAQGKFLRINTPENAPWTLTISYPAGQPQNWCHAMFYEGTGDKNVYITVDKNDDTDEREAIITVLLATTGEKIEMPVKQYSQSPATKALELPRIVDIEWFLHYANGDFSLEYSPNHKHSKWVAWKLHRGHLGSSDRTDAWQWDPRIPVGYRPTQQDFGANGYDRGHLCPSADRTFSREMNAETFMYSNMTPQNPNLNQQIWASLETRERGWVSNGFDTLYICAGGTILKTADISGYTTPSRMPVPKYNFKVILRKKAANGEYDAIGFWFENRSYSPRTQVGVTEVRTVRQIEELTGIDFFYNLPQAIQDEVENQFRPQDWGIN